MSIEKSLYLKTNKEILIFKNIERQLDLNYGIYGTSNIISSLSLHKLDLLFLAELAVLVQCSSFFFKCRGRKIDCELQPVQLKRTGLYFKSQLCNIWDDFD